MERAFPYAGDAVGDRHVGQAGAERERGVPNAGHRQAIDGSGYYKLPCCAGVFCDRNLVIISRVSELCLHCDG